MKFFYADSLDTVDPLYDFAKDKSRPDRNRQEGDVFPHELLDTPPYDGLLISRAIIEGRGARYTQGQRLRLEREGVRAFVRFPSGKCGGNPHDFPIMGDCGSFSCRLDLESHIDVGDLVDFYHRCGFTYGVSPDQIIMSKNSSWDKSNERPRNVNQRAQYTLENAHEFLKISRRRRVNFIPIGVIQSWSRASAVRFACKLAGFGYEYLGLGGMAGRPTREIYDTVAEIRSQIPEAIGLHVFGFCRFDRLEDFQGLGITSFDSTSPMLKAIKDGRYNYFLEDGSRYLAIKVPQLSETRTKRNIQSGSLKFERTWFLENECMRLLRGLENKKNPVEEAVDALVAYANYLQIGPCNRKEYLRTLTEKPWEQCSCAVCTAIGMDVVIYRGLNRNRRRGFHNLQAFYNKLKRIRKMTTLTVPCIRVEQNRGKAIYSFVVNGKDLSKFASISRISRDDDHVLSGYQRPEIEDHISDIREYLERRDSILPNSVVVAFNIKLCFQKSKCINQHTATGFLELPTSDKLAPGWIVDGQQRVAAIRGLSRDAFPISVIGFESASKEEEMEQFVLMNSVRPLPKSLLYELLPGLGDAVPQKLRKRRDASRILEKLNWDNDSPFHFRINTMTSRHIESANIKDLSILKMIENSMTNGAIMKFRNAHSKSIRLLKNYWAAVSTVYGNAWHSEPRKSRLTHGVGIISMGYVMDSITFQLSEEYEIVPEKAFVRELRILGEDIPWTKGRWRFGKEVVMPWNEIQNINRHIELVTNFLIRRYKAHIRKSV